MAFNGYTSVSRIIEILDEKYLGTLANRGDSKTWYKKHVDEVIDLCSATFEAYAINKYTLADLRIDPPPTFAVKLVTDLILYEIHKVNKRNVVPKAFEIAFKQAMKTLESWGTAQIIADEEGLSLLGLDARITCNTTEDDLEFPYSTTKNWF